MKIVYIVADGLNEYNSSNFRVSIISDSLNRAGYKTNIINVKQWMHQTEYARRACVDSDLISLQRV